MGVSYTGRVTTNPRDLDIDHLVALGEIDSGWLLRPPWTDLYSLERFWA